MTTKRIGAGERPMIEMWLRRATSARAIAVMAVVGVVASMVIDIGAGDGTAAGLHSEWYEWQAPSRLDDIYRTESLAVAPATGQPEEPQLAVNHSVHG
jgi:hypothetical protein